MGKRKRKLKPCKGCKTLSKKLSRKGYCEDCSIQRSTNSVLQLQAKEGEIYEVWKENLRKSLDKPKPNKEVQNR